MTMKSKRSYAWANRRWRDFDANTVGSRIDSIKSRNNGRCTARDVLEDARKRRSPLHSCFEWDDAVAAEEYRLNQARLLLRSVVIVPEGGPFDDKEIPLNVHIESEASYVDTEIVMAVEDLRAKALAAAYRDLARAAKKYRHFKELTAVIEAIDAFGQTLQSKGK